MLYLFIYSIICEQIIFRDKDILTQQDVKSVMNDFTTDVIIENIKAIGISAFCNC